MDSGWRCIKENVIPSDAILERLKCGQGSCGGSNCSENAAMCIECFPAGHAACSNNNQQFLNGRNNNNPDDLVIKAVGARGHGLFTREQIMPNSFIIEYTGVYCEILEGEYVVALKGGLGIDAGSYGSKARYINHSCCEPNVVMEEWHVPDC